MWCIVLASIRRQQSQQTLSLYRHCSTKSGSWSSRGCKTLSMLHEAAAMGSNVIREPEGLQIATEQHMDDLFPFTWNISQFRGRSIIERGLTVHYLPQAEPHPAQRSPQDSYMSITYPFTTNQVLRNQYQRFSSPFLRIGLILEDLDSFAADVATRHLGGLPPGYTVVTAAIDKLALTTAAPMGAATTTAAAASGAVADAPAAAAGLPPGWGPQQQQQQQQADSSAPDADSSSRVLGSSRSISSRVLPLQVRLDPSQYPLSIHSDLKMVGQVCRAGKSSMEVLVELCTAPPTVQATAAAAAGEQQQGGPAPPAAAAVGEDSTAAAAASEVVWTPRAVAHFVMVLAKSQQQPGEQQQHQQQQGPAWGVPMVVPTTKLEQEHFDTAAARAAAHRAKRGSSRLLSGVEPGQEEVRLLYDLAERQLQRQMQREMEAEGAAAGWQQQQQRDGAAGDGRALNQSEPPSCSVEPAAVPMCSTSQSHLAVMHSQDRNNANNIFGGHLLRLAAELAYSTAVLHSGRHCEAVALGDVSFRRPVPIGCVLSFRAKVVYTSGNLMRVTVVATKHQQLLEKPSELHASVTNDFTFVLCAVGSHPMRRVEPESLREAVQYLAAHRQHLADGYTAPPALLQPGMEHMLMGFG